MLPSAIKRPPRKLFRQKGQKTKIFPTCNKTASPEVIKAEGQKEKSKKIFLPAAIKRASPEVIQAEGAKKKKSKKNSPRCNKTTSSEVIKAEGAKTKKQKFFLRRCNKTASPEVIKAEGAKREKSQKIFLPAAIKQLPRKLFRQKGKKVPSFQQPKTFSQYQTTINHDRHRKDVHDEKIL